MKIKINENKKNYFKCSLKINKCTFTSFYFASDLKNTSFKPTFLRIKNDRSWSTMINNILPCVVTYCSEMNKSILSYRHCGTSLEPHQRSII